LIKTFGKIKTFFDLPTLFFGFVTANTCLFTIGLRVIIVGETGICKPGIGELVIGETGTGET